VNLFEFKLKLGLTTRKSNRTANYLPLRDNKASARLVRRQFLLSAERHTRLLGYPDYTQTSEAVSGSAAVAV